VPLSARDERMLSRDAPANARTYEYFLRANELASDPKSWSIARDLYEQAIQEDPQFAPAWAGLGRVLRLIGKLGGGTEQDLTRAADALQRALDLNPDLPLAHNLTAQLDIDRGRAREAVVRLLGQVQRRSTDPEIYAGLVYACRYCGLLEESRRADAAARRLEPSIKTSVIHTLWMLRDYDAVIASKIEAPTVVAFSLVTLGRSQEAIDFLAARDAKVPPKIRQIIGALRALLEGRREDAITGIRAITGSGFRDPEGLYYLARELAYLGAGEEALAVLQGATSAGFYCYPVIASDEWLEPIRHRPEFEEVLRLVKNEHQLAAAAFAAANGNRLLGTA
jgi:tetratricopeptide (TPR) repeat protein